MSITFKPASSSSPSRSSIFSPTSHVTSQLDVALLDVKRSSATQLFHSNRVTNAPSWRLKLGDIWSEHMRFLILACLLQSTAALSLNGFSCRVTLNIGREPGTWMPDDWAASGARMALPLDVSFSDEPVECAEPNFLQNRDVKLPNLPGSGSSTSRLQCSGGSFVGLQGEVVVKCDGGAVSPHVV